MHKRGACAVEMCACSREVRCASREVYCHFFLVGGTGGGRSREEIECLLPRGWNREARQDSVWSSYYGVVPEREHGQAVSEDEPQ